MDPIAVVSPARRRFRWACTRCLGRRSVTGEIYPEKNPDNIESETEVDDRKVKEAFFAGIFAGVSTIKAAYADLQLSQSPYDPDGIQSSDEIIVSELRKLSRIRIDYDNKKTSNPAADSHESESSLLRFEIQERKNLLKIYEITIKKLDYQLKLKQSEIIFLREKLSEARIENRALEKRLSASIGPSPESISEIGGFHGLRLHHFGCFHRRTINSVRKFVRVLVGLMDSAGWDFSAAAESILGRRIPFRKQSHLFLAIESFVCRVMFDGFDDSDFLVRTRRKKKKKKKRRTRKRLFSKFLRMKQRNPFEYVSGRPDSSFASFCRHKYLKLVHPKMEESLFAHSKQRERVAAGDFPATPFVAAFVEMAKGVWLLHCLGRCFDPEISIFQASEGNRLAEVFMESLGGDEAAFSGDRRVGFTVSPGFRAAGTVVQCQVYIC